jgi:hypothetical protein
VTSRLAFDLAARETYLALRKNPENPLYLAIRDVLTELADNPGSRRLRRLRYRPDTWAVPVHSGDARWLVLWRSAARDPDLIEVHYIGPAPGKP